MHSISYSQRTEECPKTHTLGVQTKTPRLFCQDYYHNSSHPTPALSNAFVQGAGHSGVGAEKKQERVWEQPPVDLAPAFQQQQSEFSLHSMLFIQNFYYFILWCSTSNFIWKKRTGPAAYRAQK